MNRRNTFTQAQIEAVLGPTDAAPLIVGTLKRRFGAPQPVRAPQWSCGCRSEPAGFGARKWIACESHITDGE